MQDIIKSALNSVQQEAVLYNEGPSLVIAGAGSGKTRVLTYKIAYLLHIGLPASSILALTFTNKAAREMKERIAQMVGHKLARQLWMGTFHSIFSRIIRAEAALLGYTPQFTIYDTSDAKSLLKSIVKELGLNDKEYKTGVLQHRISYAKNNLLSVQAYRTNTALLESDRNAKVPRLNEVYALYVGRCKAANAMDFDDLLYYTNVLFRDFPEIVEKYKQFFQFILVDEYQDTNFAQHLIVKRLAENHHKLSVVGDDAQSIYSFRGANIDNILNLKSSYPELKVFKLEQNYRSTQHIVNAANSLIEKNKGQIRKRVYSENEAGEKITVHQVYSDYDEGFTVANAIESIQENRNFNAFAVLYRTNAQSRVLEEALRKKNIPYRIYGGLSFYQRKEIKDVLAYLRLVINPNDEEALKRIINVPARGIGDSTVNKVLACARLHEQSAWTVLSDMLSYNLPVNAGTMLKLSKFKELLAPFHEKVYELNAYDLAFAVVKASGLVADAQKDTSPENLSRVDNIEELLKAINEFCSLRNEEEGITVYLPEFLTEVSLLSDQDQQNEADTERVTLMTVHASKGLEFSHVFVVGMEEELFPSARTMYSERELEEERRLFYVAITRAKVTCHVSYAKSRFRNGKQNFCNPSRFINDIDSQFIQLAQANSTSPSFNREPFHTSVERNFYAQRTTATPKVEPYQPPKKLTKISPASSAGTISFSGDFVEGAVVEHAIFGRGVIDALSGSANDLRATVQFESVGKKNLLLKYAKLSLVNK